MRFAFLAIALVSACSEPVILQCEGFGEINHCAMSYCYDPENTEDPGYLRVDGPNGRELIPCGETCSDSIDTALIVCEGF